jgi:hypothetical protein
MPARDFTKENTMKKLALALVVLAGLAACSQEFKDSPEQKAFKAFVEKCKADPSTPACVEYEATKKANAGS